MLVLLIMTVPTLTTRAQTEWLNNYKVHPMEEAMNPHIARPSRPDITITVWEEYVNEVWKLHAQLIDNEHGLPQWLPYDGVRVSMSEGNQLLGLAKREKPQRARRARSPSLREERHQIAPPAFATLRRGRQGSQKLLRIVSTLFRSPQSAITGGAS
jgi:hypothetical protein